MMSVAQVVICSQVNKQHVNTVLHNVQFLNIKPVSASCNQ